MNAIPLLRTGQPIGGPTWLGRVPNAKPLPRPDAMRQLSEINDPTQRHAQAQTLGLMPTPGDEPAAISATMPMTTPGGRGGPHLPRFGSSGGTMAPDDGRRIKGFSRHAAGLPDFGSLDEHYLRQNYEVPAFYPGSDAPGAASAPEVVQNLREQGVGVGKQGQAVQARADGGPVEAGAPYLVGERGPELIVPQKAGTVVPNEMLTPTAAQRPAIMPTQAPTAATGPALPIPAQRPAIMPTRPLPLTSIENFGGYGAGYQRGPRTAARRWLNSSAGEEALGKTIINNTLQQQSSDRQYARDRTDQLTDRDQAKRDREAEDQAADARNLSVIEALGSDQALLSPADLATLRGIKGHKERGSALDLLLRRREAERTEQAKAKEEDGNSIAGLDVMTTPDGRFTVPLTKRKDGRVSAAGGAFPNPTAKAATPPADLLKSLGDGYEVAQIDQDGNYVIRPKAKARESLPQLMREPDGSVQAYDRRTGQPIAAQGSAGYGDGLYSKPGKP